MSEIKKDLIKIESGYNYESRGDDYIITEQHTICDVLRWAVDQLGGDKEELMFILEGIDT